MAWISNTLAEVQEAKSTLADKLIAVFYFPYLLLSTIEVKNRNTRVYRQEKTWFRHRIFLHLKKYIQYTSSDGFSKSNVGYLFFFYHSSQTMLFCSQLTGVVVCFLFSYQPKHIQTFSNLNITRSFTDLICFT